MSFSGGRVVSSQDYCHTDYTPKELESVLKELDACLAEHIATQQADQRVIESALEQ